MVLQKSLYPFALDESSLSTGMVNQVYLCIYNIAAIECIVDTADGDCEEERVVLYSIVFG